MIRIWNVTIDDQHHVTVTLNPTPDSISAYQKREAGRLLEGWHEGRGETATPSQRLDRDILKALCELPARPRPTFSGRAHRENPASRYSEERALFEHSIGGI